MKRWKIAILSVIVALFSATVTNAAPKISLIVNGKTSTAEVKAIDGTTYVPLRAAAELLGADVNYVTSTKTVVITSKGAQQTATPTIEKTSKMTLVVNGTIAKVEPKVMSNTTYVPVRAASELLGADVKYDPKTYTVTITQGEITYDVTITFPADRYPETAAHIKAAIAKGESAVCTIDRDGADENREESLKGIPTKDGYDRDEWPMAMCAEGGTGADVAYVESSDNRGAGAWVGNALEEYPDGTRVLFVISGGAGTTTNQPETSTGNDPSEPTNQQSGTVVYETCKAAREAGAAPLYVGDPGYSKKLDRDGDGVACE